MKEVVGNHAEGIKRVSGNLRLSTGITVKTARKILCSAVFWVFILVACKTTLAPAGEGPVVEVTVVPSLAPSATTTVSPIESDVLPSPTKQAATPTPLPTLTPSNTPTPLPLSQTGPWLMYLKALPGSPYLQAIVANLDGTGKSVIIAIILENASLIDAAIPFEKKVALGGVTEQGEYQLTIVELPDLKVIQEIPFLRAALSDVGSEGAVKNDSGDIVFYRAYPPVYFHGWSPDGRYFAFSGAIERTQLDVYVYDTFENSLRRLTEMPNLALFMAWSPDSTWIVYMDASFYMPEGPAMEGIWAVSVNGDFPRKLYDAHTFDERILGWTSNHTFVVDSIYFESPAENLREVNVTTGETRIIYEEPYGFATFISEHSVVMLEVHQIISWYPDIPEGLYYMALSEMEPHLLILGSYWGKWSPELERVIATDNDYNTRILTLAGEIDLELPATYDVIPAPNGQWFLASQKGKLRLYTRDGEIAQTIEEKGIIRWLPDSTGFYRDAEGILYLHMKDNQWEGQLIDQGAIYNLKIIAP